jgi:hypothetical protein
LRWRKHLACDFSFDGFMDADSKKSLARLIRSKQAAALGTLRDGAPPPRLTSLTSPSTASRHAPRGMSRVLEKSLTSASTISFLLQRLKVRLVILNGYGVVFCL